MECILMCGKQCHAKDSIDKITDDKWTKIKANAEQWRSLDRFGDVWDNVNWDNGQHGLYMHNSCYISLCSKQHLQKAITREKKKREAEQASEEPEFDIPTPESVPLSPLKKKTRLSTGTVHNKDRCVWCMKAEDGKHPSRSSGTLLRIEQISRWITFKRHVPFLKDVEMRRRITILVDSTSDPFAEDIRYHHSCWTEYVLRNLDKPLTECHLQSINIDDARKLFFRHVDKVIFENREIRRLQGLLCEYKLIVGDYGLVVGDVKSGYLKQLLVKEYGDRIGFKEPRQKNQSEWVYDVTGGYIDAALYATGISDDQLMENFCGRLHLKIKETTYVKWPPTIGDLEEEEEICPALIQFLSWLKHPKKKQNLDSSPKTLSIASIISQYVTGHRTTTSINYGVDLHGHSRSKELLDFFHKAGFTISYADVLLLYDVWGLENLTESMNIPCEIARDTPAICVVDNDDFKIDTLTGNSQQAHRTNVMFVQPQYLEKKSTSENITSTRKKSDVSKELREKAEELTKVVQYIMPVGASSEPPIRTYTAPPIEGSLPQQKRSVIHSLARIDHDGDRPEVDLQGVPAYSGLQACLNPEGDRSKAYYQSTYPEPPSKSVMNDIMVKNIQGMRQKNIPFMFMVGDLPTYVHIVELKSENSLKFEKIIPILGPFHQQLSFIYCIYKRFRGSGISDVLVSAGVIAEGSADQALRGKHYRRGLRCLMLIREALIHIRIKELLASNSVPEETEIFLKTLRSALTETKENLLTAHNSLEKDDWIDNTVSSIYKSTGTDMGDFWISFLEMTDILAQNIHACHVRDLSEYLSSTYDMLKYLKSYNNTNYGRWLPDYWAALSSLPADQHEFFKNNFSQSLTGLPYSFQGMDLWIECTMNLGSKLKQGWLNLLSNEKQLFTTTRNVNNISRIRATIKRNLKKSQRQRKHVECQRSRIKKDECAIQDIQTCLKEFDTNPFDTSDPVLRTLQSAITASNELIIDSKSAIREGKEQALSFLTDRVFSKTSSIRDTISKNKRIDFSNDLVQRKPDGKKEKANQMEKEGLLSILNLAESNNIIDIVELLRNRITSECLSVFNSDGSMRKNQKSKALQKSDLTPVAISSLEYVALVDMGFIWRLSTPTPADREFVHRCGSEYKWADFGKKVISIITSRHQTATTIICINDVYTLSSTIKDDERDRRSKKIRTAPNIHIRSEDKFPSASKFTSILCNSKNKVRLQQFMETELKKYSATHRREIVQCTGLSAKNLLTSQRMDEYGVSHAEADTAIFTIYHKLREQGWSDTVVIDGEDADLYIQAAYVSQKVPGELLIKRKNNLVNAKTLFSPQMSEVIIALYDMTGCDQNCGFYGRGKATIIEKVSSASEARELLRECGDQLPIPDHVLENLKMFVIKYVYGSKEQTCAETRASQWKKMKRKNTQRLMPDDDTLSHICRRANYLAYCQKHFQLSEHPSPIGHGWGIIDGKCRPVRNILPALPSHLPLQLADDSDNSDDGSDTEDHSDTDTSDSDYEE